jgi:hypothetical protein
MSSREKKDIVMPKALERKEIGVWSEISTKIGIFVLTYEYY